MQLILGYCKDWVIGCALTQVWAGSGRAHCQIELKVCQGVSRNQIDKLRVFWARHVRREHAHVLRRNPFVFFPLSLSLPLALFLRLNKLALLRVGGDRRDVRKGVAVVRSSAQIDYWQKATVLCRGVGRGAKGCWKAGRRVLLAYFAAVPWCGCHKAAKYNGNHFNFLQCMH